MRTTLKGLAITALAACIIASQAYATDSLVQQRLANDNAAYFEQMDGKPDPRYKPSPLTVKQATKLVDEGKPVYSCPMKGEWFSDKPGQCPFCAMSLIKVKGIKDGKAVFEENNSMNMDMNGMDMKDMPIKDMKMMEKK